MTKKMTKEEERILEETVKGIGDGGNILDFVELNLDISKFKKKTLNIGIPDKSVVRYLVDSYYQVQELRKASENQQRSTIQGKDGDGYDLPLFIFTGIKNIEGQIKKIIDVLTDKIPICWYLKQIKGVGPMISAYLYAYIDINRTECAGSIWYYCGLNDNNTPWLGKEKAAKASKAAMESVREYCSEEIEYINDTLSKTEINKIMKKIFSLSIKEYGENYIVNEFAVRDYLRVFNKNIFTEYEKTHTCEDDYKFKLSLAFIFAYDSNFITDTVIDKLSVMDGVNRRPTKIINGCRNQHKFNAAKPYITKEDLDKYMAKPPYNKDLKVMIYKIEDCIQKQSNKPDSVYGRLYRERLSYEMAKNEKGDYAAQAASILDAKNIQDKKTRETLESGRLTLSHLHRRSLRWMAKLLLSHFYEAWYIIENGEMPRIPYILAKGEVNGTKVYTHTDYIKPEIPYRTVLEKFNLPIPEDLDEYPKMEDMNLED